MSSRTPSVGRAGIEPDTAPVIAPAATTAPLIGVTSYGRIEQQRFRIAAYYVDALRRAGAVPVILPPGDPRQARWLDVLDGIVLSGGGDIDPHRYRGPNHSTLRGLDEERDTSELALLPRVLDAGLPALLICRGAQLLNVHLGGTLHSHVPDVYGEAVPHRAMADEAGETTHVLHEVAVEPGSRLAEVLGQARCTVASWHHQAPAEIAPGLTVTARAPDGCVEALGLDAHPWLLALQWHPEITAGHDPAQQRIFDALVAAAGTG